MSTEASRIELHIDVGSAQGQRAMVMGSLLPAELVQVILAEFGGELEYLGDDPAEYQLVRRDGGATLRPEAAIAEQLQDGERLLLEEVGAPLPEGCRRPALPLYLREQRSGRVYRLPWVPAIVGRPDPALEGDELLAANLASLPGGPRVSRRHARITEENGAYFIESLSPNPTSIRDAGGAERRVTGARQLLRGGDVIVLERSGIELRLIVRVEEPSDGR